MKRLIDGPQLVPASDLCKPSAAAGKQIVAAQGMAELVIG